MLNNIFLKFQDRTVSGRQSRIQLKTGSHSTDREDCQLWQRQHQQEQQQPPVRQRGLRGFRCAPKSGGLSVGLSKGKIFLGFTFMTSHNFVFF